MSLSFSGVHGSKLLALLNNGKVDSSIRDIIKKSIDRYKMWVSSIKSDFSRKKDIIPSLLSNLNDYKYHIDVELIFDDLSNFLYRQNGQIKVSNSILEEFMPYLFNPLLVPGIPDVRQYNCLSGERFSGLSFNAPYLGLSDGGISIKTKNQDFSVSRPFVLSIHDALNKSNHFYRKINVPYFCIEIKTNLDKTMFQEAAQSSAEVKSSIPCARCLVVCEYLDMAPISTKLTAIDEVIVLRGTKRLSSDIRANFSSTDGRKNSRDSYVKFLKQNPIKENAVRRILWHLNECFPVGEKDNIESILERGYF